LRENSGLNVLSSTVCELLEPKKVSRTLNCVPRTNAAKGKWLNPDQDLFEQSFQETDVIVFDKNYFLNDDKVDQSDPTELHILFIKVTKKGSGQIYNCSAWKTLFKEIIL
jgi:hypothetical protein